MSGGEWGLYSEVQCIMGIGHMGPSVNRQTDRQTDMTENITFPATSLAGGEDKTIFFLVMIA